MAFACTIPAVATVQQDDETIGITCRDFEPGAVTGWHSHGWPDFVVMLVAGTLCIHDGEKATEVPLAQGQAYMRPAGVQHEVMNASPHPTAFVEIEAKQPAALKQLATS